MRVEGIGTFELNMRKILNANFALHFLVFLGTSPPSDMFTTGREKEQEELTKTMRLQERKGKVKKESGSD